MSLDAELAYGSVVGGRYRILRCIGRGGMSRVYLAEDQKLPGQHWAVKENLRIDGIGMAREEAQMLISLNHPRLPRIVDFVEPGEEGNISYLVMDFIEGTTLGDYISASKGRVPAEQILQLAAQLLEVLDYLHSQNPPVIYRDMKPGNIMLTSGMDVKVIDFGIARSFHAERQEDTVKLGTLGFAAPEQYGGRQSDARSDIYGLGALLLFIVTGGRYSEWLPGIETSIQHGIPRYFVPMLRKMLYVEPAERYQTAAEALCDLKRGAATPKPHRQQWNEELLSGTKVVAVLGVSTGVGATHTTISIGHHLDRHYGKAAIIEMISGSKSFARIQQLKGSAASVKDHHFSRQFEIEGVHYWRQTGRADVLSLLGGSYPFIVLDLGSGRDAEKLEELLRADIALIVGSGSLWRQQDILEFVQLAGRYPQHKWHFCLPLASDRTVQSVKNNLGHNRVFSLPLQSDPFESDERMEVVWEEILRSKLPKRRRRFSFSTLFK
ncbi:serine/threonine-protein kinase [Paenibacillus sp. JX-17]|uniref:non-specific serine/threonine protein kinase n=1 Tax=Paenibacillus lacisoli TaxID=3064525 RepID=A0ABT9C6N7_9BACL|nr:serine/threonine-protein kinase [Paenibacillus sp. JX-17]MDO7904926.1 serine/threonine-protein kinase [Paenibacillus sp. JX-17]